MKNNKYFLPFIKWFWSNEDMVDQPYELKFIKKCRSKYLNNVKPLENNKIDLKEKKSSECGFIKNNHARLV